MQPGPCLPVLCKSTSTTGTGTLRASYSSQHPKTLDQPLVNTTRAGRKTPFPRQSLLNSGGNLGESRGGRGRWGILTCLLVSWRGLHTLPRTTDTKSRERHPARCSPPSFLCPQPPETHATGAPLGPGATVVQDHKVSEADKLPAPCPHSTGHRPDSKTQANNGVC